MTSRSRVKEFVELADADSLVSFIREVVRVSPETLEAYRILTSLLMDGPEDKK